MQSKQASPNKGRIATQSDHRASGLAAWSPLHSCAALLLSTGVLLLMVLVPPTKVQADRKHFTAASAAPGALAAASISKGLEAVLPTPEKSAPQNASSEAETLTLANNAHSENSIETTELAEQVTAVSIPASHAAEVSDQIDWMTQTVRRGDNLTLIFQRVGLDGRDTHELMSTCPEAQTLAKLMPGHKLDFYIENAQLLALRYQRDLLHSQTFTRDGAGFQSIVETKIPDKKLGFARAQIQDSLFMAGTDAGLENAQIMDFAHIFGGVIDFVFDPRKGDTFSLLYEDLYLDGGKIDNGNILAAEYINSGKRFTAFRYVNENGDAGYYDADGVSMQKAFLRAPVDFTRISSSFNLRRLHPIHKRIKAHRGIDYAAPTGTPVYAAGAGRIESSGYTRANGNYIIINHGPQYTTKYLHLSKRAVKKNARVKKGQLIGRVGSTGYSTGPHLHYEFLVNGVHRNPRTILNKLPKAKSISSDEMYRFEAEIAGLQSQMSQHQVAAELVDLKGSGFSLVAPAE